TPKARGPLRRTMARAPGPGALARATIVSSGWGSMFWSAASIAALVSFECPGAVTVWKLLPATEPVAEVAVLRRTKAAMGAALQSGPVNPRTDPPRGL